MLVFCYDHYTFNLSEFLRRLFLSWILYWMLTASTQYSCELTVMKNNLFCKANKHKSKQSIRLCNFEKAHIPFKYIRTFNFCLRQTLGTLTWGLHFVKFLGVANMILPACQSKHFLYRMVTVLAHLRSLSLSTFFFFFCSRSVPQTDWNVEKPEPTPVKLHPPPPLPAQFFC